MKLRYLPPLPANYKYVYVLESGGFYKIGFAANLRSRVSCIQSGCPTDVNLVLTIRTPYYRELEQALHSRFKDRKGRGEWFELVDSDLEFLEGLDIRDQTVAQLQANLWRISAPQPLPTADVIDVSPEV